MEGSSRSPLSRAPERVWPEGILHHGARLCLLLFLAVGLVVLYPSGPGVKVGRYEAGTVADRSVIAQVDFQVLKDSAHLRRERDEAADAVTPTFIYRPSAVDSTLASLARIFGAIDSVASLEGAAGTTAALSAAGIDATAEQVDILSDRARAAWLHETATSAVRSLAPLGVVSPEAAAELTADSVRVVDGADEAVVAASSLLTARDFYDSALVTLADDTEASLLRLLLARSLTPSLVPDVGRNARQRAMARNAVAIVEYGVLEGEAIVRANDRIGDEELRKVEAYRDRLRAMGVGVDSSNVVGNIGAFVVNAMLLAIFGVLLYFFRPKIYGSFRAVAAVVSVLAAYHLAGTAVVALDAPPVAMPIAFLSVALSVLWGGRLAVLATVVACTLTVVQEPFESVQTFVVLMTGGSAAALSVRAFRRLAQTWAFIAITALALATVLLAFQLQGADMDFWPTLGWVAGSTVVGAILAIGFVPVLELATGVVTDQTLAGWADANRPLMRRLAVEAPGTFAHTIQTANLAEVGAEAIGGNGLLCRAGVYYHDVGKLAQPRYFIENQDGENPHDQLDPAQSAAILRNHVAEGVKLARRERVPEVLVDFIREHHGDQAIGFFLHGARELAEAEGRDAPDPAAFRYDGPRPRTRETAIVMLADSCESAARSLGSPTEERLTELVDQIFATKAREGQLDDCPLTFQDLEVLRRRFVSFLRASHHGRIAYPGSQNPQPGGG